MVGWWRPLCCVALVVAAAVFHPSSVCVSVRMPGKKRKREGVTVGRGEEAEREEGDGRGEWLLAKEKKVSVKRTKTFLPRRSENFDGLLFTSLF